MAASTSSPTLADRLRRRAVRQARNPTGPAGHVVGWIFGRRSSNVTRNRWAVGLLGLAPAARVLELGCGPGVALAAAAGRVTDGLVVGVDHSEVMVRQARRRNAAAVAAGRVRLVCAPVEELLDPAATPAPPFDTPFDAVLAVNNVGFWPDPGAHLATARRLLRPGGRIALVSQPRCPGATAATTQAAAAELSALLDAAGYTAIETETLDLDPPVACVLATPG
jgi:SAM-dependent methyltransferase